MSTLAQRVDLAIRNSGKTAEEIAKAADLTSDTISKLRTGKNDNPEVQSLIRFARAAGTTVGAILGVSFEVSDDDERELLRFRGWIDDKLATIDASAEPNAILLQTPKQTPAQSRSTRIADRPRHSPRRADHPFDADADLVLQALGESMIGAGILPGDTLYAIAPAPGAASSAIDKVVACRIGDGIFVKRLVSEHRRLYLLSAHPRYRPIAIHAKSLEILGTVIGRTGRIA